MSTEDTLIDTTFRPPPPPGNPNDQPSEPVSPSETPRQSVNQEIIPLSTNVEQETEEEQATLPPPPPSSTEQIVNEEDSNQQPTLNFDTPEPAKEDNETTIIMTQSDTTVKSNEMESIIVSQPNGQSGTPKKKKPTGPTPQQQKLGKYSLVLSILLFGAAIGCAFGGIAVIVQPISSWIRTPDATAADYTPLWQGIPNIFVGCLYLLNGIFAMLAGITVKAQKARIASSIAFVVTSAVCLILGFGMGAVMPLLRVFVDQGWVKQDPNVSGPRGDRNLIVYITAGVSGAIILVFCSIFMICGSGAALVSGVELYLTSKNSGPKVKRVKRKVYHVQRV